MPSLHAALTEPGLAGLYRVDGRVSVAAVRRVAADAGCGCYLLDGAAIADKASFLRACAEALRFPPYVGRNWDALEEALRDLGWLSESQPRGYVVVIDPAAPFIRRAPRDWAVARSVLASAADHWRATATPLTILLRRADGLARDLPLLGNGEG